MPATTSQMTMTISPLQPRAGAATLPMSTASPHHRARVSAMSASRAATPAAASMPTPLPARDAACEASAFARSTSWRISVDALSISSEAISPSERSSAR